MSGVVVVDASLAPYLMPVEVANALSRRVIRQEISLQEATSLLNALLATGIEWREPPSVHVKAMELAAELKQDAVYDAHYLALAEALSCELWTADERFYRAARSRHTQVQWIGCFTEG